MSETRIEVGQDEAAPTLKYTRPPDIAGGELRITLTGLRSCEHQQIEVDQDARRVSCRVCGAIIDPFDACLIIARAERALDSRVQRIKEAEEKARELNTAKRRLCRHTRKAQYLSGRFHCMSCGYEWDENARLVSGPGAGDNQP